MVISSPSSFRRVHLTVRRISDEVISGKTNATASSSVNANGMILENCKNFD
jgi:hypothetical protein